MRNWAQDEVTIYSDGECATTATELETLAVSGVVVTSAGEDEGKASRLSTDDKADLWDRMVEAAKAVFAASGNTQQKGGAV